jgi:hypothetical protein
MSVSGPFFPLSSISAPSTTVSTKIPVCIKNGSYDCSKFVRSEGMYSFPSDPSSPFSRGSVLILALLLLVDRSAGRWVFEDCIEAYYAGVRVEDSQPGMYLCFSVFPFSFLLRTNIISLPCPLA